MGLNDAYDAICGQILLLESLPGVNKAYAMILWVEKQREVSQVYLGNQENNVFLVKMQQGGGTRTRGGYNIQGRGRNNQGTGRGRGRNTDKNTKFCDHYNTPGHVREMCFQLNGYPEWYQNLKAQKESANVAKGETCKMTPFEFVGGEVTKQDTIASMLQGLQHELDKLRGKVQGEEL